jgi:hypothetical protein
MGAQLASGSFFRSCAVLRRHTSNTFTCKLIDVYIIAFAPSWRLLIDLPCVEPHTFIRIRIRNVGGFTVYNPGRPKNTTFTSPVFLFHFAYSRLVYKCGLSEVTRQRFSSSFSVLLDPQSRTKSLGCFLVHRLWSMSRNPRNLRTVPYAPRG